MHPIRAVILDFGGVLLHVTNPAAHQALARELGIPLQVLHFQVFEGPLSMAAQRGEITPRALWEGLAEQWGLPRDQADDLAWRFWQGVGVDTALVTWLRGLRPRYRTGLLSNAWLDLRDLLRHTGILDAFDALVISAEERLMKPEPAIYRLMLQRLGVAAAEAVFVDDRAENVAGAQALGMHGVLYRHRDQAIAEVEALLAA